MPARRLAAAAAVTATTAVLLGAAPAHATGSANGSTAATGQKGTADAVVLRAGLDVSLLNKKVNAPLDAVLNEVHAPANANKTALSVTLDGVDGGRPVQVARADVANARAAVDGKKSEGSAKLLHAKVYVPGLPLVPLIEVDQVTAKATCETGKRPKAAASIPGSVTVLGKKVTLSSSGTTKVNVPGLGDVKLDLARTATTARTAAATALDLKVAVNPLKLNVAEVEGRVTLVEANCRTAGSGAAEPGPGKPGGGEQPGGGEKPGEKPGEGGDSAKGGSGTGVQAGKGSGPGSENLAETGGSSTTPYIAGGAAALVAAGAGALVLARRRKAAAQID
ncbi:SCO1860 family LAETG-anchored protein [Streptomyces sp. XD-27]|uniref:SCO1860 family LAETG-anchored protein n=1 Tax=Streptomyces sp. XD-27 TaxID=3062779 RepID=UPI0026F44017|nr:SCO1860 family LAETG-anchored protein [Streptomyces sp. XD-27]WKX69686.1 SCO1860 family LAETG-anchored protein [Streptomyces sp. XD-27]